MTLLWFLKVTLILGLGLGIARIRRLSAAVAHTVLLLALLAVPLLWIGEQLLPQPLVTVETPPLLVEYEQRLVAQAAPSGVDRVTPVVEWSWVNVVGAIYVVGIVVLLARLLFAYLNVRQVVAGGICLDSACYPIRQVAGNPSPFVWGVLRPSVVVPSQWLTWSESRRACVLRHEYAHITRRDLLCAYTMTVICAFCWFHPLVWVVRRRALHLAEQACDNAVVDSGFDAATYAEHVLDISKSRHLTAATGIASSNLGARIKALLDDDYRRCVMSIGSKRAVIMFGLITIVGAMSFGARAELTALSQDALHKLTAIRVQIDDGELADARRLIEARRKAGGMSVHEGAQLANLSGYVHFLDSKYDAAVGEYRKVVAAHADIPEGLLQTTLYTLAQLYFVEGQYKEALAYIDRWMAVAKEPGPIPIVFKAQAHYNLGENDAALIEVERALEVAGVRGSKVNPNWLKLRDYLRASTQGASGLTEPVHVGADGDYMAIAKVVPIYPRAAREQKIEGHVIVEFTVASDGSTADLTVVESVPPDIFDRAALEAVRRFKYKPRVENGRAVAVPGIRNRVTFDLDRS